MCLRGAKGSEQMKDRPERRTLMQMDRIIIPLRMKNLSVSVMAALIHSAELPQLHHTAEREPNESPLHRSVPRLPARLSTVMIA